LSKIAILAFGWGVLFLAGGALAFNHPEIRWRSVVTDHFIIHYYDHTEPAVYAAWKIAEQGYTSLSELYGVEMREKINLALADYDDYSNGFANWTNATILIWISDENFDLRGNNTWLQNVIMHELAHIMTLKKKTDMQILDWNLGLAYTSPFASVTLSDPMATTMFWPEWFAEGLAQRESERAGNDGWDSRRSMILRDAILFSKPLSLAEMGHFNHNALGNELVYNQGFSFVTFIEKRIGHQKLKEIVDDGRQVVFFSRHFYPFFYEHTGLSIERLYEEWIDSVKETNRRLLPPAQTAATVLWDKGFLNSLPKLSRDHSRIGWLSNDKDDFNRTDLVVESYESQGKSIRIPWAKQSWDFSPDGKKVYYIKSRSPNEFGSSINDIFVRNLENNRETRLIVNARAYDIAIAPDNSSMACIRYRDGVFSIVKCGIDGRDMSTVIEGKIGEPFWRLSYDPNDAGKLATTRVVDGKARLCVIDFEKKSIAQLTGANAQEESPFWAKDGRIYYSADYDGINNIYSVAPDGGDCLRHTSTSGGVFSPFVVDDSTFIGTEYRNKGFRIVKGAMIQDSSFTPPDTSPCSFKPLPKPKGKVNIRSAPYEPRLLRQAWELQTAIDVNDPYGKLGDIGIPGLSSNLTDSLSCALSAGVFASRSDALEKRTLWMGLQIALQAQGEARDTSHLHEELLNRAISPPLVRLNTPRFFSYERNLDSRSNLFQAGKARLFFPENEQSRSFATRSASSDSSKKQTIAPLIVPGVGWHSTEYTLSLGGEVQCFLFNIGIPGIVIANGQAEWHLLRDVYADFSPQIRLYPGYLLRGQHLGTSVFPVSLLFNHTNYINTDIAYNFRDRTYLKGTIMPAFFPIGQAIVKSDGTDSTVYHGGSSTAIEVQCGHGFPVLRYSSVVLGLSGSETWYSEPIADPLDSLKGASAIYTALGLSAECVFPIARQINRGTRYADAFYGSFIYNMAFYANCNTLSGPALGNALSYQSYDPRHFFVEHSVGASLTLGATKSFSFSQTNTLSILWNIWAKRISVNFSAGL
jgi:hypothetical protein